MSIKQLFLVAALATGFTASVQAADVTHNFDFKAAVDRAVADGTLDGTVKFYLKGNKSGGKVLEQDIVTNQKTNGFGKSAETSCDWVLRSALIQLDKAAKAPKAKVCRQGAGIGRSQAGRAKHNRPRQGRTSRQGKCAERLTRRREARR